MEIKIVKEKDNKFFKRKDLVLSIEHGGASTPRTADLKKELATKYGVHESQVVVEYIMTKRGLNESDAKVKILEEKPAVVEKEPVAEKEETEEEGREADEESEVDEAQASETA